MVNRHRVLLVDDDPRLVNVVSMYLYLEGFEVKTAADGEEALDQVAAEPPDVVILDVMMPGINGLEVCRRLRADPQTHALPVVMFSALTRDRDIEAGRAAGADRYIGKPYSLVGLGAVVNSFLGADPVPAGV